MNEFVSIPLPYSQVVICYQFSLLFHYEMALSTRHDGIDTSSPWPESDWDEKRNTKGQAAVT